MADTGKKCVRREVAKIVLHDTGETVVLPLCCALIVGIVFGAFYAIKLLAEIIFWLAIVTLILSFAIGIYMAVRDLREYFRKTIVTAKERCKD